MYWHEIDSFYIWVENDFKGSYCFNSDPNSERFSHCLTHCFLTVWITVWTVIRKFEKLQTVMVSHFAKWNSDPITVWITVWFFVKKYRVFTKKSASKTIKIVFFAYYLPLERVFSKILKNRNFSISWNHGPRNFWLFLPLVPFGSSQKVKNFDFSKFC